MSGIDSMKTAVFMYCVAQCQILKPSDCLILRFLKPCCFKEVAYKKIIFPKLQAVGSWGDHSFAQNS